MGRQELQFGSSRRRGSGRKTTFGRRQVIYQSGGFTGTGSESGKGDSDLEATFDYYWTIFAGSNGYPAPEKQFKVGRFIIDRAWPEFRVAVELNGGAGGGYGRPVVCHNCGVTVRARKANGQLGRELRMPYPSHSGQGAERDARKSNLLTGAGWKVLTYTSAQVKADPEAVIQGVVVELRKGMGDLEGTERRRAMNTIRLSDRQVEILRLVSRGMTYPEIALSLGIAERTVEAHTEEIRRRMNVPSLAAAAALGAAVGYVRLEDIIGTSPN